jgi:uncharacterized protein (TIGR03437 family)
MNSDLSGFTWLTYVGGNRDNYVYQMQPAPDYLVHLSADGSKALAATYLPEPLGSILRSFLALDGSGNVVFTGGGFQATPGAPWPCQQATANGETGFLGKIDAAGQHLLWGTWTGAAVPLGPIAVDKSGNAVVAGTDGNGDIILSAMTTIPGQPQLVESCIVQAGYPYLPGPLAAGEIVSIYGAGFGPQQGVAAKPSGNSIATELAGVQVLIEGAPAPLLYVSSAQINLVAPYLLDGRIAAHIKIVTANGTSNEVVLGVRQAAPEFLVSQVYDDQPTAAILNQDGTLNSPDHPAHFGDTVAMFVSGLGQTAPAGVDGAIPQTAGGTPELPIVVQLMSLTSASAHITYAGNAPGLVSGRYPCRRWPPLSSLDRGLRWRNVEQPRRTDGSRSLDRVVPRLRVSTTAQPATVVGVCDDVTCC